MVTSCFWSNCRRLTAEPRCLLATGPLLGFEGLPAPPTQPAKCLFATASAAKGFCPFPIEPSAVAETPLVSLASGAGTVCVSLGLARGVGPWDEELGVAPMFCTAGSAILQFL